MKKLFALFLAVMMVVSMATVVSAETTTLTTTVPDAEYVLNVPKDQEITFGATSTDIGEMTVTEAKGFAKGKNLSIAIAYDTFKSEDVSTTIPFQVKVVQDVNDVNTIWDNGKALVCLGQADGTVTPAAQFTPEGSENLYDADSYFVTINSEDWGKALGGEYSATITFTAEVVVE